jgi:hypothetical protein
MAASAQISAAGPDLLLNRSVQISQGPAGAAGSAINISAGFRNQHPQIGQKPDFSPL